MARSETEWVEEGSPGECLPTCSVERAERLLQGRKTSRKLWWRREAELQGDRPEQSLLGVQGECAIKPAGSCLRDQTVSSSDVFENLQKLQELLASSCDFHSCYIL